MKVRTMRDIPTTQGLRNRSTPTTREQAVSEAARLEHELARLRRELDMWVSNQKKTTARMHQVEQRVTVLKEILDPKEEPKQPPGRAEASGRAEREEQTKGKGWRTVDVQY